MGFVPDVDCASPGRSGSAAAAAPATSTPPRMKSRRSSPWVISVLLFWGLDLTQGAAEGRVSSGWLRDLRRLAALLRWPHVAEHREEQQVVDRLDGAADHQRPAEAREGQQIARDRGASGVSER